MWFYKKKQTEKPVDKHEQIMEKFENIEYLLGKVLNGIGAMRRGESRVMAILDDLKAEVARNTEVDASAKVLVEGLAAKIQELINASADTVPVAELQGLVDSLRADNDALAAAVVANTPVAP